MASIFHVHKTNQNDLVACNVLYWGISKNLWCVVSIVNREEILLNISTLYEGGTYLRGRLIEDGRLIEMGA